MLLAALRVGWRGYRAVLRSALESTVQMAVERGYRVRQLRLGVERSRSYLRAEQAELKSRVSLNLRTPEFAAVSENKWNANLHRDELVRENSRLWQAEFSIRQPIILFGHPTSGYLSLNNRMYRYTQVNGGRYVSYYNRYFISFDQPFFQPNWLKYDLEDAELNLEREEIWFRQNFVNMVDDLADDYYDLLRIAYQLQIHRTRVAHLEQAAAFAATLAADDSARALEQSRIEVEMANARERTEQAASDFRLESTEIKQRLRLADADSIVIQPDLQITPVPVSLDEAMRYGETLRPRLRELEIQRRDDEIDLARSKGNNSFQMNLSVTYGREMQDPYFGHLWDEPTNSYTVGVSAYVPIWDWGERRQRIRAEEIALEQTDLRIEEEREQLQNSIRNAVHNLREYQERSLRMETNLQLAEQIARETLSRYSAGNSSVLDVLQSIERQAETAENFLQAYLGYRNALLELQQLTHYDFERQMPLVERFGMEG